MLMRDREMGLYKPAPRGTGAMDLGGGWGNSLYGSGGTGSGTPAGAQGLREFFLCHVEGAYPSTCAEFATAVYLARVRPLLELPCC